MKPKIVKKLKDKGYPVHSPHYKSAHEEASKSEKKKYPKGYSQLKKKEHKLGKHELMAKNTKSGKVEVEKKYKKYERELTFHEKQEHKNLKRMSKKSKSL